MFLTDLSGCLGAAGRSSGTGRTDRRRTPATGSVWAAWSRSAEASPSSQNAAETPSKPSPRSRTAWSPGGRRLQCLLRFPGPGWRRWGRWETGRRAAWWCRGRRRQAVWAQTGWASRRCCPGTFAWRFGTGRRFRLCRSRVTGSWRGGKPFASTSDWKPGKKKRLVFTIQWKCDI